LCVAVIIFEFHVRSNVHIFVLYTVLSKTWLTGYQSLIHHESPTLAGPYCYEPTQCKNRLLYELLSAAQKSMTSKHAAAPSASDPWTPLNLAASSRRTQMVSNPVMAMRKEQHATTWWWCSAYHGVKNENEKALSVISSHQTHLFSHSFPDLLWCL